MSHSCWFSHALLPEGWAQQVRIQISAAGDIEALTSDQPPAPGEGKWGPVIAGIPNAHSHAFQRIMNGLTEYRVSDQDSFWSWRDTMYRFAESIGPDDLRAIATQLYVEMTLAGYTSVAEFHYLHHAPGGTRYAPIDTMCQALLEAATEAGIGITLLPVLYQRGGFDDRPLSPSQRRFGCDVTTWLELHDQLARTIRGDQPQAVGAAAHSLRAVSEADLDMLVRHTSGPVHIHVAEQVAEVEQCLAATGQRPVQWLLDRHDLSPRWTLVHATHMTSDECASLAATGATVALCPTTEANLGDGLFPLNDYVAAGGELAIGSDSQISIDPREELRWLEYGQRLTLQSRNVLADRCQPHTGRQLLARGQHGGRQALGQTVGRIAPGARADLVVLDTACAALAHTPVEHLVDSWIFSGVPAPPSDVMVAGQWVVTAGRHRAQDAAREQWDRVAKRLRV